MNTMTSIVANELRLSLSTDLETEQARQAYGSHQAVYLPL